MESTNLTGVQVNDAASSFLKMMESEEPQGQPEEEIEAQAEEEVVESEEPQEEQETPRYRVKVDGQELEVELNELISGYQRTSDYTKKTQSLAEQRKVVEAERARIEEAAQLRDQYAQRLQLIEQMFAQPEEDISGLKDTDPIGYAVKMAEKVERDKQLAAVRAEREQVQMRQAAEQQERLKIHVLQEQERLRAAIPELADEAKAPDLRKAIREEGLSLGFTDQELNGLIDHRAAVTLYKAMQYDRLVKGKPQATKKVQDAPKMLKPGVSQPKTGDDQVNKLRKQLSQSGKKQDAAKLFERFL